jgi:hypothetical protein
MKEYYKPTGNERKRLEYLIGEPLTLGGSWICQNENGPARTCYMPGRKGILLEVEYLENCIKSMLVMGDMGKERLSFDIAERSMVWNISYSIWHKGKQVMELRRQK